MSIGQALANPKVLALAAAYFFVVTGSYGVELYMASIVKDWYGLDVKKVAYLIVIPAIGALIGQLLIGWNSDRTHERRWHASLPIIVGAVALAADPRDQRHAVADDRALHLGDDRHEGVSAGLLGTAQPVLDRVGGGCVDRADQLLRQSRRVRSARRSWVSSSSPPASTVMASGT